MQVNPYLHYDGNCEAAFRFYEKAAGGKIEVMMPHEGSPKPTRRRNGRRRFCMRGSRSTATS
jgi:uncharacterized glyoxalase superfamily protein PhnB